MKKSKFNLKFVLSTVINVVLIITVVVLLLRLNQKDADYKEIETFNNIQDQKKIDIPSQKPQIAEKAMTKTSKKQKTTTKSKANKLPISLQDSDLSTIPYKSSYDKVINENTVRIFKKLRTKFKDVRSIDELCKKVYDHFLANHSQEDADILFKVFKAYLNCEFSMIEKSSKWKVPNTAEGLQQYIDKALNFRKDALGDDFADRLYGIEHKKLSYKIQKAIIAKDPNLYGHEKDKMIESLAFDLWGNEYEEALHSESPRPYDAYKEKLALYKKDFEEMDEDQKNRIINEFKQEMLSPKLIKNLEEAEKKHKEASKQGNVYLETKKAILDDKELSSTEKDEKIQNLQRNIFGKNIEAVQRAESLTQKMKEAMERAKTRTKTKTETETKMN